MKFLRVALVIVLALSAASPASRAALPAVEQWDVFEISLTGPSEGNPFTDVRLTATFSDGTRSIAVDGFYDGEGTYKVRFMPDAPGEWHYVTRSDRGPLTDKTGTFRVTPATGRNHGPVRVRNTFHFAYADGTSFSPIGTTVYSWIHRPASVETQTLATLAGAPFNKVRMLVFPQAHGTQSMPPQRWPFAGTPPRDWDFSRFNPDFFRHLESRVGQLRDMGIEADLVLFHPYDDALDWGFETMDATTDDRYLRYVVARLAAYRNVWWSMANEFDFLRTKADADWDRYFQVVQAADPYDHLRSIHNGRVMYDHRRPWVTHASVQSGMAALDPGRVMLLREAYRKPVVVDEMRYEGDHELRWAQLTGAQMVRNFWNCTIAGAYGGHGEFFTDAQDVVWLAQGGALKGESPSRLAFLKRVLDEAPAGGLNPIDEWREPFVAGQPGRYYLVYFGETSPTLWTPALYQTGLVDRMEFTVDVLDTWNMTNDTRPNVLTTAKRDRYYFGDRDRRGVELPGRPYMAIRLRWSGGVEPAPMTRAPIEP